MQAILLPCVAMLVCISACGVTATPEAPAPSAFYCDPQRGPISAPEYETYPDADKSELDSCARGSICTWSTTGTMDCLIPSDAGACPEFHSVCGADAEVDAP